MEFTPKEEKDLKKPFDLLPDNSIYDFDVLTATDEVSEKGNEMIKLNIGLYVTDRIGPRIFDYLLPSMEAKLRHFCDTVGLLREYESGRLTAGICEGRSGRVKVGIQKGKAKPDGDGSYPDKNVAKDYICRPAKPLNASVIPEEHTDLEPF